MYVTREFWKASKMISSLVLGKFGEQWHYAGFVLRLHITKMACRKGEVSTLLATIANSDDEAW